MRVIVYDNGAGVSICYPSYLDAFLASIGFSEEDIFQLALHKDIPPSAKYIIIDDSALSAFNRAERDKWKYSEKDGIKV